MAIGLMKPGVDPVDVLPGAVAAARALTAVEQGGIDVVRGRAMLTVRYEAPDDLAAAGIGHEVVESTEALADVDVSRVTRRYGSRWYPLR
jgi:hypothetical protein